MKVQFNAIGEYLEELGADRGKVDKGIVRATFIRRWPTKVPTYVHVFLVAAHKVGGELIELREYIGALSGLNLEGDKKVREQGKSTMDTLRSAVTAMGLKVRGGMFKDASDDEA